jgi:molecular chaperone DnaK
MDEIRSAQEELSKVFSEAGQSFYQQQAQTSSDGGQAESTAGSTAEGNGSAKTDDVVEADYEIVDDKK